MCALVLSIIFISHDLGFLSHVVDEYYVLYGGFICEHITDNDKLLESNNLHPYTQDLISSLVMNDKEKINLGFGLLGMKERVEMHNGEFKFSSKLDSGFKILILIPIEY